MQKGLSVLKLRRKMLAKEPAICPICGKENLAILPIVSGVKPNRTNNCEHCLWIPSHAFPGENFVTTFLKMERNNPAIKEPAFHSLELDVIPKAAIDAKREELQKILAGKLREVEGWWFATIEEREIACKELARFLKPLCDYFSRQTRNP